MGEQFQKAREGEPLKIPASTYNAFIDAAVAHRSSFGTSGSPSGAKQAKQKSADIVLVQNVSGTSLNQYAAVTFTDPVVLPDDNEDEFKKRVVLKVNVPFGTERGNWFVLQEPLPD